MKNHTALRMLIPVVLVMGLFATAQTGQSQEAGEKDKSSKTSKKNPAAEQKTDAKDPSGLKRLLHGSDTWLDIKNKQVVLEAEVCQREAMLEVFACPKGFKEHEAILSVKTKAFVVHAALLAVGAKNGHPARWQRDPPIFFQATGTRVQITLEWTDKNGKRQTARAQDWIRNVKTKKAMTAYWVFGGSGFSQPDAKTGKPRYLAEGGAMISVSNFPDAMLDLSIESSESTESLLFEPFKQHIPPVGTKVRMYLKPVLEKKKAQKKVIDKKDAEKKETEKKEAAK